jgi:hypothetical protein
MRWAVGLAIAACSGREPIASCDDDLRGVYTAGAERWMVLDHGATLEAYPLFPDVVGAAPSAPGSAALEIAPRVIDLDRAPAGAPAGAARGDARSAVGPARLAGTVQRRYLRRGQRCEARAPVQVARCAGDTLELVLADPSPPIAFSPCTWTAPGPSRTVRWRRE